MKIISTWRCLIVYTLLCIGLLSLLAIFADDNRPLGEWLKIRVCLGAVSAVSFYVMHRLRLLWECNDKVQ